MRSFLRRAAAISQNVVCLTTLIAAASAQTPQILFDTDFRADCDDAGALGVLHALADLGECEILGIGISDRDPWSPRGVDSINHFYGRPNIPIGIYQGNLVSVQSSYSGNLAHEFHNDQPVDTEVAFTMYRRILAQQPNNSVKIVTTGFLTNLYDLLNSAPDAYSPLPGDALIAAKVAEVAMLAGSFPSFGPEFNTHNQGLWNESQFVISELDRVGVDVTFVDFEISDNIRTGDVIRQSPETHPVGAAYDEWLNFFELATGQPQPNRPAWDHCVVYYAVRGLDGIWTRIDNGRNVITANGNSWQVGQASTHGYVRWLQRAAGEAYLLPIMRSLQQAPPAAGRNPYSVIETFEDGTSGSVKKRSVSGSLQADFGKLLVTANGSLIVTGRRPGDQTIITEIDVDNTQSFASIGVMVGAPLRDGVFNAGPRVEIVHFGNAPDLRIRLVDNLPNGTYGEVIPPMAIPGTAPNVPLTLRIDVQGTQLRASVNGVERIPPTTIMMPGGLNYTFLRSSFPDGGARLGYLMIRDATAGPGLSIDADGTLWFSEIEPAAWDTFPGLSSGVFLGPLFIEAGPWKLALRDLGPHFAFETLGLGSHMIYGLRNVNWLGGETAIQLLHNNSTDGLFVRRRL